MFNMRYFGSLMIFVIFSIYDFIEGGLTGYVYVAGKNMNNSDDKPKI